MDANKGIQPASCRPTPSARRSVDTLRNWMLTITSRDVLERLLLRARPAALVTSQEAIEEEFDRFF